MVRLRSVIDWATGRRKLGKARVPCDANCGRFVPIHFLRGLEKGLCRKCRRAKLQKAKVRTKTQNTRRYDRNSQRW